MNFFSGKSSLSSRSPLVIYALVIASLKICDAHVNVLPNNQTVPDPVLPNNQTAAGPVNVSHNKQTTFPAVITFGDSIVDTGNNDYIPTIVKCNFAPYGKDFEGGKPTGRFSNGKVPSDLIAEYLGIKKTIPSYLRPNLQLQDLLTGVSFASGGTGYDPFTARFAHVLSTEDQLKMFKEYIKSVKAGVGEQRLATLLSKSLFVCVFGSNDLATTFVNPIRRLQYDSDRYTDLVVNSARDFYQKLYALGARKIAVFSAPPIGCLPLKRTLEGGLRRDCSEFSNKLSVLYNNKLSLMINALNKEHPDIRLVYIDIYNTLLSMIKTPAKYGFEESSKGCCGPGTLQVSIICNVFVEKFLCKNDDKYVFWDSFHPTEEGYKTLTKMLLTNETIRKFF